MTNDTTGWMTASGPAQSPSPLATTPSTGAKTTVGNGGLTCSGGGEVKQDFSGSYTTHAEPDAITGHTFMTKGHGPIGAGGPKATDLVEIGGMKVEVQTAIQMNLIEDVLRPGYQAPQRASGAPMRPSQTPNGSPQGNPAQAPEQDSEGDYSAADDYAAHIAPRLSSTTTAAITADLNEGQFSEATINNLTLEGNLSADDMESVRSSYVDKVSLATGMDEDELAALYASDRPAVTAAIGKMLKNGSTAAFQKLAAQANAAADEAAYTPLSTDEASAAWQSADFPQALLDADLEPSVDSSGAVCVNIPSHGVMRWTEAVQRGLVKVSRS